MPKMVEVKVPEAVMPEIAQRLSYKEFFLRNSGNLNRLLLGALEFFHGKEKHSEDEWMELFNQVSQRRTR